MRSWLESQEKRAIPSLPSVLDPVLDPYQMCLYFACVGPDRFPSTFYKAEGLTELC